MTGEKNTAQRCITAAGQMRTDALRAAYNTGRLGAHIGGTLSMIEIMAVLYLGVMNIDPHDLTAPGRDRFILSKGHGVLAQYAAMKQAGIITDEEFMTFKQKGTALFAHPSRNPEIGIEFSSGSLGQGVSLAVGAALALKRRGNGARVYVLVGDGECDEGQVWEAVMSAAQMRLDNLTVIVDKNNLQYDGRTDDIISLGSLKSKFEAFGFEAREVDGHNVNELLEAFSVRTAKPYAVICDTVKGKGVSFMENNPLWHNGTLSEKQYKQALEEQEAKE